jgi:hypothetical protein
MAALRTLWPLALADLRERARRYSFLVTLGVVAALAWSIWDGRWTLRIGDYQGELNAAWIGVLVSLATTLMLSLFGFYVVKGAVERDRSTRVGEILATTPISRFTYLLGKALSNFLVLAVMVALLAAGAALMALGQGSWALGDLVLPLALLTLPALAVVAAVAVLFECVPGLSGAFGNVLYFFLWGFALSVPIATSSQAADVIGFQLVHDSLQEAVLAQYPDATGLDGMGLTLADSGPAPAHRFLWHGLAWRDALAGRAVWLAVALALVLLAVPLFDRFDPARDRRGGRRRREEVQGEAPGAVEAGAGSEALAREAAVEAPLVLTPLAAAPGGGRFLGLVRGELALLLSGRAWWWYLVAAGLGVACLAAPTTAVRPHLVAVAWVWAIAVFSALGCRSRVHGTTELLDAAPHPVGGQTLAAYAAGLATALLLAGPALVRLLATGEAGAAGAVAAGALFVPALALALGEWTGTPKVFEGVFTALWYLGILNGIPALDFLGGTEPARAAGVPGVYAALAVALVAAAVAGRRARLGR